MLNDSDFAVSAEECHTMNRRMLLGLMAGGGFGALAAQRATRGVPSPRIRGVDVIATAPEGARLVVVKITTDQDGLYGYGCATFAQRADLVVAAVQKYLRPFLTGKTADRIDDIWQACYNSSYWRSGPVLNAALSGIDMALWDIKGRQAGLPVYQLLGGKCREAVDTYAKIGGAEIPAVIDGARKLMAEGFRNIRVQIGIPGMAAYGHGFTPSPVPLKPLHKAPFYEAAPHVRRTLKMLEACRKQLGDEIELLHDVHERLPVPLAIQFAKDVEQFKLFFVEDLLAPEDIAWFARVRQLCSTPLAMGELFTSPHEWIPLIKDRLIDFIRVHMSQVGGFTPCRKMAAMAELVGVRTAWHFPPDLSPVGMAAALALDVACPNFGIQEWTPPGARMREVFSGCPEAKDGYLCVNEAPGWGVEVDEKAAARYPFGYGETGEKKRLNSSKGEIRRLDGTIIRQ
jgi:mannonate dehydratase